MTQKTELEEALEAFYEMRKKVRKPMTDYAKKLLFKKVMNLSGMDEPKAIDILNQSIMNSWTDIYPLKEEKNKTEILIDKLSHVRRNTEYKN